MLYESHYDKKIDKIKKQALLKLVYVGCEYIKSVLDPL